MSSLCTQNLVTEMDVRMVKTPDETRSYKPVAYGDVIDVIKLQAEMKLPNWEVTSTEYGLARDDQQLFGLFRLQKKLQEEEVLEAEIIEPDDKLGLSIGFRTSHDKSLSLGVVVGAYVFVCDNLMLNTNGFKCIKRHTPNVWETFDYLLYQTMNQAGIHFVQHEDAKKQMVQLNVEQDRGFEVLGRMYGHKLLTPVQMSNAVEDWRNPAHKVFEARDAWSLYNATTMGLKKGSPSLAISRYCKAHDWFMENLSNLQ